MAEFIDEKSPKAKGKRLSTLDIRAIENITPAPAEPEPEDEETPEETDETPQEDGATTLSVADVPMTIVTHTAEEKEENGEEDADHQLSLF